MCIGGVYGKSRVSQHRSLSGSIDFSIARAFSRPFHAGRDEFFQCSSLLDAVDGLYVSNWTWNEPYFGSYKMYFVRVCASPGFVAKWKHEN